MSKNMKNVDVDALVNDESDGASSVGSQRPARRRVSPALGAAGQNPKSKPVKLTDTLKTEISRLKSELEAAKGEMKHGQLIEIKMPVSGVVVDFEYREWPIENVVVSQYNKRLQEFLDPLSLADIIPSMTKSGQTDAGLGRKRENGLCELADGSRRLASANFAGLETYKVLVGNIPDIDMAALSDIGNQQKELSQYEKAVAYRSMVEEGLYKSWSELAEAERLSTSTVSRLKACAALPEIFVKVLGSPTDMPSTYGESISKLLKLNAEAVTDRANELFLERSRSIETKSEWLEASQIIKTLKNAITQEAIKKAPSAVALKFKSNNGVTLKQTRTNKGATKLEFSGLEPTQVEELMKDICSRYNLGLIE